MKKYILAIAAALLPAAFCAAASPAEEKPCAAVYVKAQFPVERGTAPKGVVLLKATWPNFDKNNGVTVFMPTDLKWKNLEFSFIPSQSGKVEVQFRTRFFRGDDGKISTLKTCYAEIAVNGKLRAFEKGLKGWKRYGKPTMTYSGDVDRYVATSYSNSISLMIDVEAGKEVKISALARNGGKDVEFGTIGLSACANLPFDGGEDGDFYPLPNLPKEKNSEGAANFNGIDFKIAGGALALCSPRANNKMSAELKCEYSCPFRFLYVLQSSGKIIRKKNRMKNVGSIEVAYADGTITRFWIKSEYEAMPTFSAKKGDNAMPVYVENKKEGKGAMYMSRYALEQKPIASIAFRGVGYAAWNIAGVTLSSKEVATSDIYEFDPKQWRAVDISDLEIRGGSALDVSAGMGHKPAGKFGRLKISQDGKFYFEGAPNERVKFKGTNWRPGDQFFTRIKTKEDIDVLAKAARKQGYNMVRWRFSMKGKREFDAPYKMKPEVLDLYDYFMYAMAREGVYTHLNLSSHDLGDPDFVWTDRYDVKMKMFLGDPHTRDCWSKLVHMQLNHVNPYSGKKWKDDPAIATTEYFNEMELGLSSGKLSIETRHMANTAFREWLKKKYGSISELNEAWKKEVAGTNFKKFSEIKVFGDHRYRALRDRSSFLLERAKDFLAFCENVVRVEEKFDAPLHQFNCARTLDIIHMSAEAGSYMAQNVYFAHPSEFNAVDSRTPQHSSLEPSEALNYFRGAVIKNMPDRPMALTEWQHCHWNPYKHEAGATFPALAAFNDFDNLTVHDYAIEKHGSGIFGHAEVARSPIMRANEFLSYCFFFRGDVKPSPHRVDLVFDKKFVAEDPGMAHSVNAEQSKLSFLTGFAIDFPGARKIGELGNIKPKAPDAVIAPSGYTLTNTYANFVEAGATVGGQFDLGEAVKSLRQKGILPPENITDISKQIYQSDTGEITLRLNDLLAKVETPMSEAVAIKPATKNEKAGTLTVKSTSVPALVALASVDGKPLSESRRMVFIYSTDTRSTDFKLSPSRELLKSRGKPPILVMTGVLSAEIDLPQSKGGTNFSLYALTLSGERAEKIPAQISDGKLLVNLDTNTLKKEPAVFYELVAE
ncbi:MAG: beta-galactosidase [Opitutales bacterium]|nr:beta-galactosidase [Opitutales bacterium]